MTVVITERRKSRPFTMSDADPVTSSATLLFTAYGSWSEVEVQSACDALIPSTWNGMFRQSYECEPQGGAWWYVEAKYSPLQPKKPGESSYEFDTSASNQHITVSKETIDSGLVDDPDVYAPDLGGAIGVNGDSIEGVDIKVPTFAFSETHFIPTALVTAEYKLILFGLTALTNEAPWHGLELGEVLFLGARGSIRGTDFWEISYKFECSANAEDIPIPGTDETIDFKYGWEYLWYRFQESVGTAGDGQKFFVRKPVAYYIERVYDAGDFTLLGLGT